MFVSYPLLRDDVVFVTDAASVALNGLNDSVLLVRMRAAWALANISDVLVLNRYVREGRERSFLSCCNYGNIVEVLDLLNKMY